jgi:hypothetical protein
LFLDEIREIVLKPIWTDEDGQIQEIQNNKVLIVLVDAGKFLIEHLSPLRGWA